MFFSVIFGHSMPVMCSVFIEAMNEELSQTY